MAEEVTKVVEDVDKLFSEIVVNGESHVSDRYTPPEPAQSTPVSTNQEEEQETPVQTQEPVQGQYVDTIELNNIRHDLKDSPLSEDVAGLQSELDSVEELIPNQASASNQLADKNFVNSSIATNTANFLGTYTSLAEIEAISNPTNNDYAFLETTDSAGNTLYDRYKYSGEDEEWLFEYELNNSGFTAEQWATINSGLTQSSVEDLVNDEVTEALASPTLKQPIFDFCHPIGEVYTQYPNESDPATLYNVGGIQSTWTELDYGGAFFRAKGGNANDYDKELTVATISTPVAPDYVLTITFSEAYTFSDKPVLIFNGEVLNVQEVRNGDTIVLTVLPAGFAVGSKVLVSQGNTTAVNGLRTNSSADGTGTDGRTPSGGSHEHRITAGCEGGTGNEGSTNFLTGSASGQPTKTMNSKNKANTTNSSHYHEIYLFGDEETRPENFTIRVWKRTA